jgi:hypothetical protein
MTRSAKPADVRSDYAERRADSIQAVSIDIALIHKLYFGEDIAWDYLRRAGIKISTINRVLGGRYRKRLFDR